MKKATPPKQEKAASKFHDIDNTTGAAQRQRILVYLRDVGPANTMFMRDRLNIMAPAARVNELREQGHKIHTTRITINDGAGRLHPRVARYILVALAEVQG